LIKPSILFPVFSSFTYRIDVGYCIKLLLIEGPNSHLVKLMVGFLFNPKEDALIRPVRHCKRDSPHYENDPKKALDVLYVSDTLLQKTTVIHFQLSFKELYTHSTASSSNTAESASSSPALQKSGKKYFVREMVVCIYHTTSFLCVGAGKPHRHHSRMRSGKKCLYQGSAAGLERETQILLQTLPLTCHRALAKSSHHNPSHSLPMFFI